MPLRHLIAFVAAVALSMAWPANAALYTTDYGVNAGAPSNCDDCFSGPWSFGGGQTINFFGVNYGALYVGSNGYVTFDHGLTTALSIPVTTQGLAPMIAGFYTDLDSRDDADSNVWVNALTPGQLIVTWDRMGHYQRNYSARSTFQLVARSDVFAIPEGEGNIGLFYGDITDAAIATAGVGDGLAGVQAGEFALLTPSVHQLESGLRLNQHAPVWANVPEPASLFLTGVALLGLVLSRKFRS